MAKEPEFHLDIFDREIRKGSFVVASWWNSDLEVCVVDKLSPKMVKLRKVNEPPQWSRPTKNKYPEEMMVVESEDVTLYILKNAGKQNDR